MRWVFITSKYQHTISLTLPNSILIPTPPTRHGHCCVMKATTLLWYSTAGSNVNVCWGGLSVRKWVRLVCEVARIGKHRVVFGTSSWFGLFYVLFFFCDTLTNIPHNALGQEVKLVATICVAGCAAAFADNWTRSELLCSLQLFLNGLKHSILCNEQSQKFRRSSGYFKILWFTKNFTSDVLAAFEFSRSKSFCVFWISDTIHQLILTEKDNISLNKSETHTYTYVVHLFIVLILEKLFVIFNRIWGLSGANGCKSCRFRKNAAKFALSRYRSYPYSRDHASQILMHSFLKTLLSFGRFERVASWAMQRLPYSSFTVGNGLSTARSRLYQRLISQAQTVYQRAGKVTTSTEERRKLFLVAKLFEGVRP